MAAKDIEAGRAFVSVSIRNKIDQGLKVIQAKLKGFGDSVGSVGSKIAAFGAPAAALGAGLLGGIAAATTMFAQYGDSIAKAGERTGMSAEALSELGYAAEQSGSNLETLEKGVKKLQQNIFAAATGSKEARAMFSDLGVDLVSLATMTPESQFETLAKAIGSIPDPTSKAAMAMQVFGKAGSELIPMISGNLAGLRAEAADLGLTLSQDDANAAVEFGDAMDRISKTIKSAFMKIGAAIAEPVTIAAKLITTITAGVNRWMDSNRQLVQGIIVGIAALAAIGMGIVAFGGVLIATGAAISMIATAIGVLFSPIGLFFTGLLLLFLSLAVAAYVYRDALVASFQGALEFLQPVIDFFKEIAASFAEIGQAIMVGRWDIAAGLAMTRVQLAIAQGWSMISNQWAKSVAGIGFLWDMAIFQIQATWITAMGAIARGLVWLWQQFYDLIAKIKPAMDAIGQGQVFGALLSSMDPKGIRQAIDTVQKRMETENQAELSAKANQRAKAAIDVGVANDAREKGLQAKIDSLQSELGTAVEEAQVEKEKQTRSQGSALPELSLGATRELGKLDARGTFSAAAAGLLGGPRDGTQETASNTRQMVRMMQDAARRRKLVWES